MISKNVKKILIDQDINITKLAEMTGYSRTHLSAVINGRLESPRVKRVIALSLNKDISDLWNESICK